MRGPKMNVKLPSRSEIKNYGSLSGVITDLTEPDSDDSESSKIEPSEIVISSQTKFIPKDKQENYQHTLTKDHVVNLNLPIELFSLFEKYNLNTRGAISI
jgi:hypothetical protein